MIYKCDYCEEIIQYELTEFLGYKFCDNDCLDKFIEENKVIKDIVDY